MIRINHPLFHSLLQGSPLIRMHAARAVFIRPDSLVDHVSGVPATPEQPPSAVQTMVQ
jgi:hypothetical protein